MYKGEDIEQNAIKTDGMVKGSRENSTFFFQCVAIVYQVLCKVPPFPN